MNYLTLILSAYLAMTSYERSQLDVDNGEWEAFKMAHQKSYENDHIEMLRKTVYAATKHEIEQFNSQEGVSSKMAINHLADIPALEIQTTMNGFKGFYAAKDIEKQNTDEASEYLRKLLEKSNDTVIPESVDWRQVPGRVSSVQDQGRCGSCWAFASVGALEGQEYKKSNKSFSDSDLIGLSVQNLVDCDHVDQGCDGGLMANAFNFIAHEGGLDDSNSYPYRGFEGRCHFKKNNVVMQDKGAAVLESGNEEKLKQLVATYGPVAVAIDASQRSFQMYQSGVYSSKTCQNKLQGLDHGVLVVGYGTCPEHGDYWIVKNSWGKHWGMDGYVKMARNKNNMCGIATYPVIPMV